MQLFHFRKVALLMVSLFTAISTLIGQNDCEDTTSPPDFITINLPAINEGLREGTHEVPKIWNLKTPLNETIQIPNGRPIYALIVSGYASNAYLDELMLYNFARYLMDKGAYVHYSWWNNLLAPYMERPLHHEESDPGNLGVNLAEFATPATAALKALPGEDYQFVADAKIFLRKIREYNPNAIIIVAGHSMGGGAVVHLGSETNEIIDILAPIDPVGNRNLPFAGPARVTTKDFNWTRWRVSRDNFRGYRRTENTGTIFNPKCTPTGEWLRRPPLISSTDPLCTGQFFVDNAPTIVFKENIVNLFHRYQKEAAFPFDFYADQPFVHTPPQGGLTSQGAVETTYAFNGLERNQDPGGWPLGTSTSEACCSSYDGVGWAADGHGEIIGYRGPGTTVPLGVRLRTSPNCGDDCAGLTWPARTWSLVDGWSHGDKTSRKNKMLMLENFTYNLLWPDRPYRPELCLVSNSLINFFADINKAPIANAGQNQIVECTGQDFTEVILDGSSSTDENIENLEFIWTSEYGTVYGEKAIIDLPLGVHCILLTINDETGYSDTDTVLVTVEDTTAPELYVTLTPNTIWPPNHKMIEILAIVNATDLCGSVVSTELFSIESSDAVDELGSGNTEPDIMRADFGTEDLSFDLRAEMSGKNGGRTYSVTYKAIDDFGNASFTTSYVEVLNKKVKTKGQLHYFFTTKSISYEVATPDNIDISIHDLNGKKLMNVENGFKKPGNYLTKVNTEMLASGVYLMILKGEKSIELINRFVIK
ncbi:T9SS type A sorting domain-containing protein [Aegicerativicinus sediminis]|uniref:T9SS type A sorting domain-containing protein n=1 Tax=Aegicerativicinus sediminis TaxID=2893202 RepID=UPI001E57BA53|nr:T9SS type A sorting domain-containing protein [Aegicerativicinus sediminis]